MRTGKGLEVLGARGDPTDAGWAAPVGLMTGEPGTNDVGTGIMTMVQESQNPAPQTQRLGVEGTFTVQIVSCESYGVNLPSAGNALETFLNGSASCY
jgi:hypothetical protein